MIPKTIHYCWFGGKPKSELIEKCIASWRKFCPDWEIIEWNEDNWDISTYQFAKAAYESKYWAYVSDVARLDVICKHGGVYLDTDVELLNPIDDLLDKGAFFFSETSRNVNSGMGFGAEKGHPAVQAMLDYYSDKTFSVTGKNKIPPCPAWNTAALVSRYPLFQRNGQTQRLENLTVFSGSVYARIGVHHSTGNWTGNKTSFQNDKRKYKASKIKSFFRRPECFNYIERHFGKTGVDIYTFLVYDLQEYGANHYIQLITKRLSR